MDVISIAQLDIIKQIDFERGCEFIDGQCRRMRLVKLRLLCCNTCAANVGYLNATLDELPEDYKSLFNHRRGFLGDTGCRLPKDKRSVICSSYACLKCNISDEEHVQLEKIKGATVA